MIRRITPHMPTEREGGSNRRGEEKVAEYRRQDMGKLAHKANKKCWKPLQRMHMGVIGPPLKSKTREGL
eukprot:3372389-Prorocentrum_lima.AAC.1